MEIEVMKEKMQKTIDNLSKDFATIRTGRASSQLLDRVQVEYYGFMTPLRDISQITIPDAHTVMIKPYEEGAKVLAMIEKAIVDAQLGMAPNNDGSVIRLNVPSLTEERRKEFCKKLGKMSEESKVAIRNIRRDANDQVKKDKILTEDQKRRAEKDIQTATDEMIKKIDEMTKLKEKDIMSV